MVKNKDHDNERFRFFYEKSVLSYQSLDEKGYLLEVNPAWLELLGYTNDEVIGHRFGDFLTSESQKHFKDNFSHFKATGEIQGVYLDMVHKDGHIINIETNGKIAYDKEGRFKQTYCTLCNITDRKQAEEVLKNRYSAIIEHSKELYYIHDDQGKINYISPRCKQIFGYSMQEMMVEWTRLITDNPINQKGFELTKKALETGERQKPYLLEARHKDGKKIFVEINEAPLKDKKGKVIGITGALTDITIRKQTEDALRESEEQFRTLFEYAPDAYIVSDLKRVLIDANKAAEKLTGYKRKELIGMNFLKLKILPSDQIVKGTKFLAKNIIRKSTDPDEIILTKKDGTSINMEINTFPINIKGKNFLLSIARDITERKKYEDKIKYLSFHDNLTGLYNRTYFEEELARLDTVRQLPISIVTGDLNGLKLINDTFGHEEGDELLRRSAKLLESCCRADDIIARWGGDEFSILLPKTTGKEANEFINRIKKECLKTSNNKIPLSISLGFSTKVSPDQNIQEIIRKADDYMYRHKLLEIESTSKSVISIIERAMFERSDETEKHTIRVKDLSLSIGRTLGLKASSMEELALLASLHDIGKIAIPESILKEKSPLTGEDWKIIKKHSEIGCNIAHASIHLALLADNILSHHERWDGTGYPRGLKATAIPIASRIVSIVDAYDVMTHNRPYRKAISKIEAIREIKRCSGTQFDSEIVSKFTEIIKKGNPVGKRKSSKLSKISG